MKAKEICSFLFQIESSELPQKEIIQKLKNEMKSLSKTWTTSTIAETSDVLVITPKQKQDSNRTTSELAISVKNIKNTRTR